MPAEYAGERGLMPQQLWPGDFVPTGITCSGTARRLIISAEDSDGLERLVTRGGGGAS